MRDHQVQETDRMLGEDVFEPAMSELASSVMFAARKDGNARFSVDYGKLNAMTVRDTNPLPRMDECVDSTENGTISFTRNCSSAYWKIETVDTEHDNTTISGHYELFQSIWIPFGLKNAPASLRRASDVTTSRIEWKLALFYLDVIIVYSGSVTQRLVHVRTVPLVLGNARVALRL